jgi:NAD(P)H-nitrite reductase large subunit
MIKATNDRYVIIGHSAAALAAARAIRDNDTTDSITIIAAEESMAYSPVLLTYYISKIAKNSDKLRLSLNNGQDIETDTIIAGKGVTPNIQLTENTGIATDYGILVNNSMQTNIENIFASAYSLQKKKVGIC